MLSIKKSIFNKTLEYQKISDKITIWINHSREGLRASRHTVDLKV